MVPVVLLWVDVQCDVSDVVEVTDERGLHIMDVEAEKGRDAHRPSEELLLVVLAEGSLEQVCMCKPPPSLQRTCGWVHVCVGHPL